MTGELETGQAFAARHWGGEGVVPEPRPADRGPRDVDGGRVSYPAGWSFQADCGSYRVWEDEAGWHMEANDGGFAKWHREGRDWIVDYGWSQRTARVPALDGES